MKSYTIHIEGPQNTQKLAFQLSAFLKKGDILGLRGNLGSGKTTFVQGLAQGLKILESHMVSSPTFTFINEYPCCGDTLLFHMDFYRLSHSTEAQTLGLDQYFQGQGICAIEWFEKAAELLPKDFLEIEFQAISEKARNIHMIAHGLDSQKILSNFLSSFSHNCRSL